MKEIEALIKTLEIYIETDNPVSQKFWQGLCFKALTEIRKLNKINPNIVSMPCKELKKLQLKARLVDKLPFCPDHRDKVADKECRECRIKELERILQIIRRDIKAGAVTSQWIGNFIDEKLK